MSRVRLVASFIACCLCVSLAPAAAKSPSPHWQLIADPAPGATGLDGSVEAPPHLYFTVAHGTPYLAEISRDHELTVYRTVGNRSWRELSDGPLNPPGTIAVSPDLTAAGDTAWLAWEEFDNGAREVHVARLTRSGVRELPGSPIAQASLPQIAYFGGRLYVAYSDVEGMHSVRTRADGRGFEQVAGFDQTPTWPEEMGVYRGRLYVSDRVGDTATYWLLNRRQSGWVQIDAPADDPLAQRIGETVYTLGSAGGEGPGAPVFVRVFATRRGVTRELPSPAQPGDNVQSAQLLATDGTLWMAWVESGPADMAPPFIPHVARLIGR